MSKNNNETIEPCPPKEIIGLVVYDEEQPANRHFDKYGLNLEIVQKGFTDHVVVHYTGPREPDTLILEHNGTEENVTGKSRSGGRVYEFDVKYDPKSDPYFVGNVSNYVANALMSLLTFASEVTTYRARGLPRTILIPVYNPDQWSLEISLPPLRGTKVGRQLNSRKTSVIVSSGQSSLKANVNEAKYTKVTEESNWREVTTKQVEASYSAYAATLHSDNLYAQASGQRFEYRSDQPTTSPAKLKPSFKLKRNNRLIEFDGVQLILGVLFLISDINRIIEAIKACVPKIGWYIDYELKVCEGKAVVAWGWREHTDHQAFYYVGASIELTIFEISFEFGVGLEICAVGVQVCLQLKGGLTFSRGLECSGPADPKIVLGKLELEITPGGYVRFKAGKLATITGGIKGKFTFGGEVEISLNGGAKATCGGSWDGATLMASVEIGLGLHTEREIPIADKVEFGKFEYPGGEEPKNVELTRSEITRLVEDVLTDGWNLRVFRQTDVPRSKWQFWESGETVIDDVFVPPDEVADVISTRIWRDRYRLLLTRDNVDLIANAVRKRCDTLADRDFQRDYMYMHQLTAYLEGAEMKVVLKDAEDPGKVLRFQAGAYA